MQTFRCPFVQVYGLTETTGAITQLPAGDHAADGPRARLLRSAGKPFPWVELRIVEPGRARRAHRGEVGELWTRSVQNIKGYWERDEETARTLVADGWLRTGDAGFLDEEGYLFLTDRVKDMIISGGENVYPAEVENALSDHPAVADVAVIGVPDERWGETIKAIVVRRPGPPPRPPTSSLSRGSSWRTSSARPRSISWSRYRATRQGRSSSASCANPTGRAARGVSTDSTHPSGGRPEIAARQAREAVIEVDGRAHRLHPVAEVEAFVLGVGLGVAIGHTHEDARGALQEVGERLDEADGTARPDHSSVLAEASLECGARRLERGPLGIVVHNGVVLVTEAVTFTP